MLLDPDTRQRIEPHGVADTRLTAFGLAEYIPLGTHRELLLFVFFHRTMQRKFRGKAAVLLPKLS
jgi:hypothetical protein